jgi:hypothetical protein
MSYLCIVTLRPCSADIQENLCFGIQLQTGVLGCDEYASVAGGERADLSHVNRGSISLCIKPFFVDGLVFSVRLKNLLSHKIYGSSNGRRLSAQARMAVQSR